MTGWRDLKAELDRWAHAGQIATFWWRDDDATIPTPELDALLRAAEETAAPLALAVIPAEAGEALASRLSSADGIDVLQHGWAHRNHEPEGRPKSEFGPARSGADALAEVKRGRERTNALFGVKALPVLAPPWNRIDPDLVSRLPAIGVFGLSTFKPRGPASPGEPIRVNTHVDIVNWRAGRGFVGDETALATTTHHLAERREARVDPKEPTGILSHHLVHDEGCVAFLERMAALVAGHPGAAWVSARELFPA